MSAVDDVPRLVFTVEEAADRLGVKRTTMYKLIRDGAIESFTIGRLRKISLSAIQAYIERKDAAARSDKAA